MSRKKRLDQFFGFFGFTLALLVLGVGIHRAYSRGSNDFSVFYHSWKLVLEGSGIQIYRDSPDRFLYAPGFAWLLSPLAFFSRPVALTIWSMLKCIGLSLLTFKWLRFKNSNSNWNGDLLSNWGMYLGGVALLARPVLIDLEYGQVNLFVLIFCAWALLEHFSVRSPPYSKRDFLLKFISWFLASFAALSKLFPLPILLVPWMNFVRSGAAPAQTSVNSTRALHWERIGVLAGISLTFFIPFFGLGWDSGVRLLSEWHLALVSRGLPLESHNQSFVALLYHYFSGAPTHVISEGMNAITLGAKWLTLEQIRLLSLFWTFAGIGAILSWLFYGDSSRPLRWIAILIGLIIIPSHLIWKPYFVLSIPLALLWIDQMTDSKVNRYAWMVILLFTGINLTSFDFIGHHWSAQFEAASLLLLCHLGLLAWAIAI